MSESLTGARQQGREGEEGQDSKDKKEKDGKKGKKDKKLKKHRFGNCNGEASAIKRRRLLKPKARPEAKSTKVYGHEVPEIGGTMVSDGAVSYTHLTLPTKRIV